MMKQFTSEIPPEPEPLALSPAPSKRPRRHLGGVLVILFSLTALLTGGYLLFQGLQPETVIQEHPLPTQADLQVEPVAVPVEDPALTQLWPVERSETGGGEPAWEKVGLGDPVTEMSVVNMEPSSVLFPAIKSYSLIRGGAEFGESKYSNFQGLQIPYNPRRAAWYSDGAPLVGGENGTTVLASHISKGRTHGTFYDLHTLAGGETVWTKDASGDVQQWEVVRLWHALHTNFPQEYFSADGVRQLVLTTCGGKLNSQGYYRENIFAVAVPVGEPITADYLASLQTGAAG